MTISISPEVSWSPSAMTRWQALLRARPSARGDPYAVLDAAIDESLYDRVRAEPVTSAVRCLYDGDYAVRYARYAPYLLRMHADSPLCADWLDAGWAAHWGVVLISLVEPDPLKRHLKRFLRAQDPVGRAVLIRFYDPRVLPDLLAALEAGKRGDWFNDQAMLACLTPRQAQWWRGTPSFASPVHRLARAAQLRQEAFPI